MEKPPYRIPTMAEIATVPWNGLNVVSTFSGCGGSCLGYRMAGFRVLWANEFVLAAQASYRANMAEGSILDGRDIRSIQPGEILDAIGVKQGDIDILDGSPPCASFSTAGKRADGWGRIKPYSDTSQRTDDLFFEYARLLKGLMPRVFVAENVSGLVKGVAKGYFLEILAILKACNYRVKAKLLDAQWLGVPQSRRRIIFVGVRNDLGFEPVHPTPLAWRYTVGEAWRDVPIGEKVFCNGYAIGRLWSETRVGEHHSRRFNLDRISLDRPCSTIRQFMGNDDGKVKYAANVMHSDECRYLTLPELRRVSGFPDDFVLLGTFAQGWERLGRAVPPLMMKAIAEAIRDRIFRSMPR